MRILADPRRIRHGEPREIVCRGEVRPRLRRLGSCHQDAGEDRGTRHRHLVGSAGPARPGLCPMAVDRAHGRPGHRGPVHQDAPVQPRLRLRAVPARPDELQRRDRPARTPVGPVGGRARPARLARRVAVLQPARHPVPGLALRPGCAPADGLHRQRPGRARGQRGALLPAARRLPGRCQPGTPGRHRVRSGAGCGRRPGDHGGELRPARARRTARCGAPRAAHQLPQEPVPRHGLTRPRLATQAGSCRPARACSQAMAVSAPSTLPMGGRAASSLLP